MSESISIYDVASRAQVSISTVSRVLNRMQRVAPKTRRKVEEAIRALNYHPSNHARALMLHRSDAIGLIIPDLGGDYYGDLMRGIDQRAKESGMHLLVARASGEKEELSSVERLLGSGRVDGLIIAVAENTDQIIQTLSERNDPIVVLDCDVKNIDGVRVDNRSGSREATEHLIKTHGLRRLRFVGGPENNVDTIERADGFREALAKNNLPESAGHTLFFPDYDYNHGYEAGEQLIKEGLTEKLGIVAANDDLARGVIDALFRAGISVPENGICVVGYDDSRVARFARPTLTTVRVPLSEIGSMAIDMVMDRLSGRRTSPIQLAMKTELIIRQSCGCGATA
jgi:LacI family transcriptional regulator